MILLFFNALFYGPTWKSPLRILRLVWKYRKLRVGQATWNLAYDLWPTLAEPLRGGDYDPFYNDRVIGKFWAALGWQ